MVTKQIIKLSLFMFAAVSIAVPLAAQDFSEQAKAQLTMGEQFLRAGDLGKAQVELQKVIDNYPLTEWTWWARVHLSSCYYQQKRFDECILEARKVVNLYPAQAPQLAAAWAQLHIGTACQAKQDAESAVWELGQVEKILGNHPDRGPALAAKRGLAITYHGRNERKKAVEIAKEMTNDPNATAHDRAWAFTILGSSLLGDKKLPEGFVELKKVRDMYPGQEEQLLLVERKVLEYQYIGKHDYDGAIKEAKWIATSPNVGEVRARQARYFIALACLYKKDYAGAIAEAQALLDKYPKQAEDHIQMYMIKARAFAMLKDYAQAIKCIEAALATKPSNPEVCATAEWDIATCLRAMGDIANAQARFQRLIELYPQSHLALRAAKELGR